MNPENIKLIAEIRHKVGKHLTDAGWVEGPLINLEDTAIAILRAIKVLEDNAEVISEVLIDPHDTGAMDSASYARLIAVAAETGFDIFP